jgi:hypothetical protein
MSETNGIIELGDIGKDKISGFTGVVVAITTWLHACRRITLQPRELKDGEPVKNCTFDGPQIELVEKAGYGKPEKESKKTGGPSISPVRSKDPM